MPYDPEAKRGPGAPRRFLTKPQDIKFYVDREAYAEFRDVCDAMGIPGTEIGRRLLGLFLSASEDVRRAMLDEAVPLAGGLRIISLAEFVQSKKIVAGKIGPALTVKEAAKTQHPRDRR